MSSRAWIFVATMAVAASIPLVAAAGAVVCQSPPTRGTGNDVEVDKGCFFPALIDLDPGEAVTFRNLDPFQHNVVGHAGGWGQIEGFGTGGEITVVFDEPGIYPFACTLHPGMVGAVFVGTGSIQVGGAEAVPPDGNGVVVDPSPQPAYAWWLPLGWWLVAGGVVTVALRAAVRASAGARSDSPAQA